MTEVENDAVPSETLQMLARACGVATDVHLIDGTHVRCSRAAILAALEAMGIRGDTDERAGRRFTSSRTTYGSASCHR